MRKCFISGLDKLGGPCTELGHSPSTPSPSPKFSLCSVDRGPVIGVMRMDVTPPTPTKYCPGTHSLVEGSAGPSRQVHFLSLQCVVVFLPFSRPLPMHLSVFPPHLPESCFQAIPHLHSRAHVPGALLTTTVSWEGQPSRMCHSVLSSASHLWQWKYEPQEAEEGLHASAPPTLPGPGVCPADVGVRPPDWVGRKTQNLITSQEGLVEN